MTTRIFDNLNIPIIAQIYLQIVLILVFLFFSVSAQASGLSPSSTEDTGGQKGLGTVEATAHTESKLSVSATDEKPSEEPESNDTSYGVEATAVRTLAASTGTVAILGTTAKVKEASELQADEPTAEHRYKDNPSISVTEAQEEPHEKDVYDTSDKLQEEEKTIDSQVATSNNDVLQQKEQKQIENEAIQEKQLEPQSSAALIPEPIIPSEDTLSKKDDSSKEIHAEIQAMEKLPEPQETVKKVTSAQDDGKLSSDLRFVPLPNEELIQKVSQLPKIVDYQEKRDIPLASVEDTIINNDLPLIHYVEEDSSSPESNDETAQMETEALLKTEESQKISSDVEAGSPDESKTDEDNDISSEQLKTNSLSDMSLSEAMNSEGEEAAREAAKALELQEMVASLSASANDAVIAYNLISSEAGGSHVGTSVRKLSELEQITHETIIEEKLSPETNGDDSVESDVASKVGKVESQTQESPSEISEQVSNDSNDTSKQTEESKISDKEDNLDIIITEEKVVKENDSEKAVTEVKGEDKLGLDKDFKIADSSQIQTENKEISIDQEEGKLIAAATTIQSSFRGYKVRKDLKDHGNSTDASLRTVSETNVSDEHSPESTEKATTQQTKTIDLSDFPNAPESLVKIAQAEVDKICTEAEKTTENIMTPPPAIDRENLEAFYQNDNEEFPAPPDDLLDMNERNDTIKEDQDSSGTDPTIPLGTNNTDGDSSKTEDTTAPSLAESEVKSIDPTASQQNVSKP